MNTPSVDQSIPSLTPPTIKAPTVKAQKLPTAPTKINVTSGKGTPGGFTGKNTTKVKNPTLNVGAPSVPSLPTV